MYPPLEPNKRNLKVVYLRYVPLHSRSAFSFEHRVWRWLRRCSSFVNIHYLHFVLESNGIHFVQMFTISNCDSTRRLYWERIKISSVSNRGVAVLDNFVDLHSVSCDRFSYRNRETCLCFTWLNYSLIRRYQRYYISAERPYDSIQKHWIFSAKNSHHGGGDVILENVPSEVAFRHVRKSYTRLLWNALPLVLFSVYLLWSRMEMGRTGIFKI